MLVLKTIFLPCKKTKYYSFLCSADVDNSTFFLKDELHAVETMKVFKELILFSSFRPNKSKCEVSGVENE